MREVKTHIVLLRKTFFVVQIFLFLINVKEDVKIFFNTNYYFSYMFPDQKLRKIMLLSTNSYWFVKDA